MEVRPLLCGAGLIAPLSTLNFLAEWGCLLMDQDVIVKKKKNSFQFTFSS